MIEESLDQGKDYPMNSWKNWIGNSGKVSVHLVQKFGKLTPSKTKCNKSVIGILRLHLGNLN
jgi:hypothetical protein